MMNNAFAEREIIFQWTRQTWSAQLQQPGSLNQIDFDYYVAAVSCFGWMKSKSHN